jgi:hypothetical protein
MRLDQLERRKYTAVIAMDSLEHNKNVEGPLRVLETAIVDSGVLDLSGPTENCSVAWADALPGSAATIIVRTSATSKDFSNAT